MRFSMSIDKGDVAPVPPSRSAPGGPMGDPVAELRLLEAQLERMRGMLFGYSRLFFATIRNWTFACVGLLVLGWSGVLPAAVVPVPFLVPFAFLETGYLFWYTVFARRHAEYLERAINERLGSDLLVAHRLEAAYFYPPDAPKIAALSFGNPLGFMSVMTVGYSVGAALVWAASLASTNAFVSASGPGPATSLVVPAAIAWTAVIAGYLVWASLRAADEERLVAALDAAYPPRAQPAPAPAPDPVPSAAEPAPPPALGPPGAVATSAPATTTPAPAPGPAAVITPEPGATPGPATEEPR